MPDYDPKQGYELAGFVWFQGWNDMCDGGAYPDRDKPGGYDLYSHCWRTSSAMCARILSAPNAIVIGVMGVGGIREEPDYFRLAMAAPAALPEFAGNVVAVQTAPFWDEALVPAYHEEERVQRDIGYRPYALTKAAGSTGMRRNTRVGMRSGRPSLNSGSGVMFL